MTPSKPPILDNSFVPITLSNSSFGSSLKSPLHRTLTHERGVQYFYHTDRPTPSLSRPDSIDKRLGLIFGDLIESQLPEAVSMLPAKISRSFKISFDITEGDKQQLQLSQTTRDNFWKALPFIQLIELNGPQSACVLAQLLNTLDMPFAGQILAKSSLRLNLRHQLSCTDINSLSQVFHQCRNLSSQCFKKISFNQSLFFEKWEQLLGSLSLTNDNSSEKFIEIALNDSFLLSQKESPTQDHCNTEAKPLSHVGVLCRIISLLPDDIGTIDLSHSTLKVSDILYHDSLAAQLKERFCRSQISLYFTLNPAIFSEVGRDVLHQVITHSPTSGFDFSEIFRHTPCETILDYFLESTAEDENDDTAEIWRQIFAYYRNKPSFTLRNLPENMGILNKLIEILPSKTTQLSLCEMTFSLDELWRTPNFVDSLLQWSKRHPDNGVILDISKAQISSLSPKLLHDMIRLADQGLFITGISAHHWRCYLRSYGRLALIPAFQDNMSAQQQCYLHTSLPEEIKRSLTTYCHSQQQDSLEKISFLNNTFVSQQILGKKEGSPGKTLLKVLCGTTSKHNSWGRLQTCPAQLRLQKLTWDNEYSRCTHIALCLWRYAQSQSCPLYLKEEFVTRMLSSTDNPFVPAEYYGFMSVTFTPLPQLVVDSLTSRDHEIVQQILQCWYFSLSKETTLETFPLIKNFYISDSHDPTKHIINLERKGLLQASSTPKTPMVSQEKHLIMRSQSDKKPSLTDVPARTTRLTFRRII